MILSSLGNESDKEYIGEEGAVVCTISTSKFPKLLLLIYVLVKPVGRQRLLIIIKVKNDSANKYAYQRSVISAKIPNRLPFRVYC